jgi:predicted Zn-dependent protease
MKFGPKANKQLDKLKAIDPNGFFSRYLEATQLLYAPKTFGGDPDKALLILEKLSKEKPQNEEILCFLAEAYGKTGKSEKSLAIVKEILADNPKNLFAKRLSGSR